MYQADAGEGNEEEEEDTYLIDHAYGAVQKMIALLKDSEHKKVALKVLKEQIARAEAKKDEKEDASEKALPHIYTYIHMQHRFNVMKFKILTFKIHHKMLKSEL